MGLNLFPVRVPIGKAGAPDGRQLDVLMTPEFARALSSILERIGGPDGVSNTELAALIKALQEQALQLVGQIQVLFDLADKLADAIEDQAVNDAATPDQIGIDNFDNLQLHGIGATVTALASRLDDIALQQEAPAATSALTQQLSDVAMLLALHEEPPPLQKNTVTGAKGGNAALTSLLAALAKSGIITDLTT